MVEVYFYIPTEETDVSIECGLKLSKWSNRTIKRDGKSKEYISALLNPKDDPCKYNSNDFNCLKLELPNKYCAVADRILYLASQEDEQINGLYVRSIVPVDKYKFGTYRMPEVLISCTVLPDRISQFDKRMDSPILFDDSQELYVNNLVEDLREKNPNFYDMVLYLLFCELYRKGSMKKISGRDIDIFMNKNNGDIFTLSKPTIAEVTGDA